MQYPMPTPDTSASVPDSTVGLTVEDVAAATDAVFSPEFWLGVGTTALRIALTVGLALLAISLVTRIKRRWVASVQDDPATDKRRQRVLTTSDLLGSVARYVIWAITIVTVLSLVGFDIRALLAGAGHRRAGHRVRRADPRQGRDLGLLPAVRRHAGQRRPDPHRRATPGRSSTSGCG